MVKHASVLFLILSSGLLSTFVHAQAPAESGEAALPATAPPSPELLLEELDKRRPDENSPFFALREDAAFFNTEEGRRVADSRRVAVYPNTAGQASVAYWFQQFGQGMAKSFRFGKEKPGRMTALEVTPGTSFKLEDRREITASLSVTNHGNQLLSLEFPTIQRFDFVIRDAAGAVIERWSDDRSFAQEQGVIMVNPGERIQYEGLLATRELVAGQVYTLEAGIAGHPEFAHQVQLTPY
jgi:hypothetical protein